MRAICKKLCASSPVFKRPPKLSAFLYEKAWRMSLISIHSYPSPTN